MINWTRVHFRHAMNMAAGSLLVVLAFWMNEGRVSVLMGVSGTFIVAIGVTGWLLDEAHDRFMEMNEIAKQSLERERKASMRERAYLN